MTNLYPEDIQFTFKAVEYFTKNHEKVSYPNEDRTLLALRWGADNDCIKVLRLEGEVLFLNNCMPAVKLETKVVDEDTDKKLKDLTIENLQLRVALEHYADPLNYHHFSGHLNKMMAQIAKDVLEIIK